MTIKRGSGDRFKVYRAMTVWCKAVRTSSSLTLASMQDKHCYDLPCYDLCLYENKERERK